MGTCCEKEKTANSETLKPSESNKYATETNIVNAIHYAERDTNKLQMFNSSAEKIEETIIMKNGIFYNWCETGSIGSRIQMFGGAEDASGIKNTVFEIDVTTNKFIVKSPLKCPKVCFSLVAQINEFFLIGGTPDQKAHLADCDAYNIIDNNWSFLPSLNNGLVIPGTAILNSNLFVIGGINANNQQCKTIMKINLDNRNKWENINQNGNFIGKNAFQAIGVPISKIINKEQILTFGGNNNGIGLDEINQISIVNDTNQIIEKLEAKLPEAICFYNSSAPVLQNGKIFCFAKNGNLFVFDLQKRTCKKIDKKY